MPDGESEGRRASQCMHGGPGREAGRAGRPSSVSLKGFDKVDKTEDEEDETSEPDEDVRDVARNIDDESDDEADSDDEEDDGDDLVEGCGTGIDGAHSEFLRNGTRCSAQCGEGGEDQDDTYEDLRDAVERSDDDQDDTDDDCYESAFDIGGLQYDLEDSDDNHYDSGNPEYEVDGTVPECEHHDTYEQVHDRSEESVSGHSSFERCSHIDASEGKYGCKYKKQSREND